MLVSQVIAVISLDVKVTVKERIYTALGEEYMPLTINQSIEDLDDWMELCNSYGDMELIRVDIPRKNCVHILAEKPYKAKH